MRPLLADKMVYKALRGSSSRERRDCSNKKTMENDGIIVIASVSGGGDEASFNHKLMARNQCSCCRFKGVEIRKFSMFTEQLLSLAFLVCVCVLCIHFMTNWANNARTTLSPCQMWTFNTNFYGLTARTTTSFTRRMVAGCAKCKIQNECTN